MLLSGSAQRILNCRLELIQSETSNKYNLFTAQLPLHCTVGLAGEWPQHSNAVFKVVSLSRGKIRGKFLGQRLIDSLKGFSEMEDIPVFACWPCEEAGTGLLMLAIQSGAERIVCGKYRTK